MVENLQEKDDVEVEMNSGRGARHGRFEHTRLFYNQRSMHDMQNAWRQVNEFRYDEPAEQEGGGWRHRDQDKKKQK